jgi:hypothetical protein
LTCLVSHGLYAQEDTSTLPTPGSNEVVQYDAGFFSQYRPNTALDMVNQLPGFQLDDGGDARGFATSAGNILINGRRPSAKQDLPSATLARIPARQVDKIELIRGQAEGIDFQGHSIIANIYLRTDVPASVRWQVWFQHNNAAPPKPGGSISMSDRWGNIDFNTGIDLERDTSGWYGTENEYDADGRWLTTGPDESTEKGFRINSISLNASSWLGRNFIQLNSRYMTNTSNYFRPTANVARVPGIPSREVIIDTDTTNVQYEIGADLERALGDNLSGKLIFLFVNTDTESDSSRENIDSLLGRTLLRQANTDTGQEETIGRIELDWSGLPDHAVQLNLERAYNVLDRGLLQTDDRGTGPVVVNVPGANSRVEEVRWDGLLQDTWSLGRFDLDLGLGAEASTLRQTGDSELERNFFFYKPHVIFGYASGRGDQTRLRLAREVSQLDLEDFVSATVFEDNDLALGNPNIQPDTTWVSELIHERRFGDVMVIKLTMFHHWISDVLDLLPLSEDFEAPGNIGDGRRWGLKLEGTLPLDWLGLQNARLDLSGLWQDSTVTDPVTGLTRRLSGEGGQGGYRTLGVRNKNIEYSVRADFRQDFQSARVAWGWTIADRADRPLYKVNELDVHNDGVAINAFVETTRWFGIKTSLLVENMLDFTRSRDRTLYSGARELSAVDGFIESNRFTGRRFTLYFSDSF